MSCLEKPLLLLALAGAVGCTDDELEPTGRPVPMTISVDPLKFLGDVECAQTAGAMQSFVATVTDRDSGFVLASSPPGPCTVPVGFEYVIEGHVYTAEVDGYEQAAGALVPLGGTFSGSRTMQGADGATVEPRWTTSCGEGGDGAAVAQIATITTVQGCTPLVDAAPSDQTSITVDVTASAAGLGCAQDDGAIAEIRVVPRDPSLPEVTVACGSDVPITYDVGIVPGELYEFDLLATAPDADEPGWGARCFAIAKAGIGVSALCDPLTDNGAIAIDPLPVWASAGVECPGQVSRYSITLTSETDEAAVTSVPCDQPLVLAPVRAGDYGGTLVATDAEGAEVLSAACGVAVPPGGQGTLLCTVNP